MLADFLETLAVRDSSLSERSRAAIASGMGSPVLVHAGEDIVTQGSRPLQSTLILDGWASRYSTLSDGRRQMLSLHIGGDFVDLHSYPLKLMDHSVGAVTDCSISRITHARLRELTDADPHLGRVLWLLTLIDAAILRKWLLGSGQQKALERAAHLFCELFVRLKVTGKAEHGRPFEFPLSHAEVGDALGISAVHVSRTLGELRERNLVEWRRGQVDILDWDRLQRLAEFDPAYLSLFDEPR